MNLRTLALLTCSTLALVGCNDTLDSVERDVSHIKNKVSHPLSPSILSEMAKRDMDRNSPIMVRVFKEEGTLEIWKAKRNNRYDLIASYSICAWSGKLGPKIKEGDRQAPEGFYNLSQGHLNPNSSYYLAINTGFPNRYDSANKRTGSNLMIHGACSSSGCYSMTDAQMLEIYAFARDAFKGGQKSIQFAAFPFRMTAENMARHRKSEHFEFWKMLKNGYDNFEITKRPPEVNVCEKRYVFNQQTNGGGFNPSAACPDMTTPPALASAMLSYTKTYDLAYTKAADKYDGKVWYDPSETERKALVAHKRKGRAPEYAPTGSSLAAGRLMSENEYAALIEKRMTPSSPRSVITDTATTTASTPAQAPVAPTTVQPAPQTMIASTSTPTDATVPVPSMNPLAYANTAATNETDQKKPFWKFWAKND